MSFSSDRFMRLDLAAILSAIALTAAATGSGQEPQDAAYRRGFAAAIAAIATATHITPTEIGVPMSDHMARLEAR